MFFNEGRYIQYNIEKNSVTATRSNTQYIVFVIQHHVKAMSIVHF